MCLATLYITQATERMKYSFRHSILIIITYNLLIVYKSINIILGFEHT